MGGSTRALDEKTIKDFNIKLMRKKWWDDQGHSGIEEIIWVEVNKSHDFYLSKRVCIRHAHDRDLDQPHKDAYSIKDVRVDSDDKISVRLTGSGDTDYWIIAPKD